jgi:HK97 family phage portal protein
MGVMTRNTDRAVIIQAGKAIPMRSFVKNAVRWSNDFSRGYGSTDYDDVTLAEAFAVSVTAWACASKSATILSSIPLQAKRGRDVVHTAATDWALECSIKLLTRIQMSLLIWGRYYLRKRRNEHGYVPMLEWLNPLDVTEVVDQWTQQPKEYLVARRLHPVPASEMIVGRLFNPLNDLDGISAYELAMKNIEADKSLVEYAGAFFFNSARPDGMLSYEGDLTDDEYTEAKENWKIFKGVRNAFKTFITGAALAKWSWQSFSSPPADLAMPELKNLLRSDTCSAFDVHPALIGIGTTSDPLSAQGTYEQIRLAHIQDNSIPRLRFILEGLNSQWLKEYDETICLEPDLSEFTVATLATPERSTVAQGNYTVGLWGVNDGRKYTGHEPLTGHLDRNPTQPIAAWNAGGLRHGEFRAALGLEPDPMVKGYIWDVDPRAKGAPPSPGLPFGMSYPQLPAPSNQPSQSVEVKSLPEPAQSVAVATPEKRMVDYATPEALPTQECCVMLSLSNHPVLCAIQSILKEQYPAVQWSDPASFHVTMVYASRVTDLGIVRDVLPKSINPVTFEVGPIRTFDEKTDGVPVYLAVTAPDTLLAMQCSLATTFKTLGFELSEYSAPECWVPHVTLGYVKAGYPVPIYDDRAQVTADKMECSIEVGERYETVYITRSKEAQAAQLRELSLWRDKVRSKGATAKFTAEYLPENVAVWVRERLAEAWPATDVFDAARSWVREGDPPVAMGASAEDAEDYWRNYDELKADMGAAWINYQRQISAALFTQVVDNPQLSIPDTAFDRYHADLLDQWVGTEDNPGILSKLMIAGMAAGDVMLQREKGLPPGETRALTALVDWTMINREAVTFARSYGFDLIKGIDDTTRSDIGNVVSAWLESGSARELLHAALQDILIADGTTPNERVQARAALIGDEESMNAYDTGALRRWTLAGVDEGTWQTVRQGPPHPVCNICAPMHGQVAKLSEGWYSPTTGQRYKKRAHIKCRCFKKPRVQ